MADAWLWETGDRILLEDGSGVWILETQSGGGIDNEVVWPPEVTARIPVLLPLPAQIG